MFAITKAISLPANFRAEATGSEFNLSKLYRCLSDYLLSWLGDSVQIGNFCCWLRFIAMMYKQSCDIISNKTIIINYTN